MASLVGGLLGQLKPGSARGLFGGGKQKPGQASLRGMSKRAYLFEVFRREAIPDLGEVGAVYVHARTAAPDANATLPRGADGTAYEPGYIGSTADLARREAEHDRHGHFIGFAFDVVLVLRLEQEKMRAEIEADLVGLYRPVLNELLRGYQRDGSS
jgi:hypothetical protein